jgi:hypothetical protein
MTGLFLSQRLWTVEDIAAIVEAADPKPSKRGPYKQSVEATA